MSAYTLTLSDDNWGFIIDSLGDRLENLNDLNTGDFGMIGEFDKDIQHCESIIKAIQYHRVPA